MKYEIFWQHLFLYLSAFNSLRGAKFLQQILLKHTPRNGAILASETSTQIMPVSASNPMGMLGFPFKWLPLPCHPET
jgi:hypothetical protein